MKKRLISVMLAGFVSGSVLGVSACKDNSENSTSVESSTEKQLYPGDFYKDCKDVNIVINQKGKEILHKGDIDLLLIKIGQDVEYAAGNANLDYGYDLNGTTNSTRLTLDCGTTLITNKDYSIFAKQPSDDWYDEVCEECFGIEE